MTSEKVFRMKLSVIYDALVKKAERKNRTRQEVDECIFWLCGYDEKGLREKLEADVEYKIFFDEAPAMNPNAHLITGRICGVRVEEIEDPTMKKIRQLDKMIDELAKGRPMEKICRK